jgi:hypothetical protein
MLTSSIQPTIQQEDSGALPAVGDSGSLQVDPSIVNAITQWKPAAAYSYDPNNKYAGTNITLGDGQVVPYNAVVQQMLTRIDQDQKNPALGVKSALQLGIARGRHKDAARGG